MADKDKYADEMLTDDKLDVVVGGTRAETQELITAMYKKSLQSRYKRIGFERRRN